MKHLHIAAIALFAAATLASCSQDTTPDITAPEFNTAETKATNVYRTGAMLQAGLNTNSNTHYDECGIAWSKSPSMSDAIMIPSGQDATANRIFYANVTGLLQGQTYYYCAYAKSGSTTIYGDVFNFTTPQTSAPAFTKVEVSNTSFTSCDVKATMTDNGVDDKSSASKRDLIIQGFIYKKVNSEADNAPLTFNAPGVNAVPYDGHATTITQKISDLQPNSTYAVQAYGVLYGVGYSSDVAFIHTTENTQPAVSTITLSDIEATSFRVSASIIDQGNTAITEHGFCYSTDHQLPDLNNSKAVKVSGTATDFNVTLTDMLPGATYYVRAYAKNGDGGAEAVGYGDVLEVTIAEKVKIVTAYEYPDLTDYTTYEDVQKLIEMYLAGYGQGGVSEDVVRHIVDNYMSNHLADYPHLTRDDVAAIVQEMIIYYSSPESGVSQGQLDEVRKELLKEIESLRAEDYDAIAKLYDRINLEHNLAATLADSISARVAANTALISSLQQHYDSLFAASEISHQQYESVLAVLQEQNKEQYDRIESLEAIATNVLTMADALFTRVSTLEADFSALTSKISDMEGTVMGMYAEIAAALSQHKAMIDDLDKRVTALENAISQIKQASPLPVIIDSCSCTATSDSTFTMSATIDYAKYQKAYNDAFGVNPVYGAGYYTSLYPIVMTGFIYSTIYPEPNISEQKYNKMIVTNSPFAATDSNFSVTIPVTPSVTTYYVRAFAVNGYGTTYSEVVTLKLGPDNSDNPFPGVISVKRR